MKRLRNLLNDQAGAAAVEAAIVTPVLLTLAFGGIEFSNLFWDHQHISTGVRDAARYLARVRPQPPGGAAEADAKEIAVYGKVGGSTPRVDGWTTGDVSVTTTPIDNSNGTYAHIGENGNSFHIITVTATVTYSQIGMLSGLGLTPPTFTVSHSERAIGD